MGILWLYNNTFAELWKSDENGQNFQLSNQGIELPMTGVSSISVMGEYIYITSQEIVNGDYINKYRISDLQLEENTFPTSFNNLNSIPAISVISNSIAFVLIKKNDNSQSIYKYNRGWEQIADLSSISAETQSKSLSMVTSKIGYLFTDYDFINNNAPRLYKIEYNNGNQNYDFVELQFIVFQQNGQEYESFPNDINDLTVLSDGTAYFISKLEEGVWKTDNIHNNIVEWNYYDIGINFNFYTSISTYENNFTTNFINNSGLLPGNKFHVMMVSTNTTTLKTEQDESNPEVDTINFWNTFVQDSYNEMGSPLGEISVNAFLTTSNRTAYDNTGYLSGNNYPIYNSIGQQQFENADNLWDTSIVHQKDLGYDELGVSIGTDQNIGLWCSMNKDGSSHDNYNFQNFLNDSFIQVMCGYAWDVFPGNVNPKRHNFVFTAKDGSDSRPVYMLTQLLKISDNGQNIEPVLDALENPSIIQEINTIINNPNSNTTQRMVEMFGDGDLNISFTINNNNNIEIRISDVNFNEHQDDLLELSNLLKNELSNSMGVDPEVFTINFREGSIIFEIVVNSGAICFLENTPVLTDQGEISIQDITTDNSINGIYVEKVSRVINIDNFMILIRKDALAHGVPSTDTCISKNHHIFINGHAIKAKHLVNKKDIFKVITGHQIIYNVLLENGRLGKMIVNNMLVETLNKKYLSKMIKNNNSRRL